MTAYRHPQMIMIRGAFSKRHTSDLREWSDPYKGTGKVPVETSLAFHTYACTA
jgi:hypothetical protein